MTISGSYTPDAYTGNASTTEFPVTYPFFGTSTDAEIEVIERTIATGAEATLVNGTDYTVAGGSGSTGTVTATTAPAATVQWIIRRTTTETQETDYVENDPFPAESHEAALDRLTLVAQEATEASSRALQFPVSYTGGASNLFPEPIASTVIQWNAAANALEGGPTTTEISNAESNATAAAASAAAAASSAASAATTYDNFDDRYLGAKASDPTFDNDGDALIDGALYFDTTLNVMKFYDLGNTAWKQTTPTSADQTNIDAAVANASNINAVAAIDTDVTAVAGISSDVTTVAADGTDIGTVAGISANITTVAGISSDVTTVAGISGDVSSVAAQVIGYDFSTTTAMADPGSGNVRFNNATVASVTAIAIDDLDKNGVDQSAYIALFDDSTNTVKGTLVFRTGGGDVATFNITGLTDNTGWFQIAVTHVASSGTFSNGEDTFIGFTRAGDKGADGAGSGDVSGPASATDNALARYDGTGGKTLQNSGVTVDDSGNIAANNLSGTNTGDESAASATASGIVELATSAEVTTGTDTVRAVTPEGLHAGLAGLTDTTITAADAIIFSDATDSGKLKEDTVQGILDLALPYVAPSTSGNLLTSNGSAWTSAAPAAGGFTLGTEQASTSGTSITFGGIPSGVRIIVIMFQGVSFSGAANVLVTIGDSGGLETSGYISTGIETDNNNGTAGVNSTSAFVIRNNDAGNIMSGTMTLTNINSTSHSWISSHTAKQSTTKGLHGGGEKSLTAELTQVSISGGTFDAGSINIMYQ
jgi:hypothetical protein